MLAFLSRRASAAHLALVAVAPLVLCEYPSVGSLLTVSGWLVFLAAIWAFMSPAAQEEESVHNALRRFLRGMLTDPFFWSGAVFAVYSATVALNTGVALAFDADALVWRLSSAAAPALPGGVGSAGVGFLSASLASLVLYSAVVHSLDSRMATAFSVIALLMVIAIAVFGLVCGRAPGRELSPAAYGIWSLVALSTMLSAARSHDRFPEMVSMLAFAVCLLTMASGGHPEELTVFAGASAAIAAVSAFGCFRSLRLSGTLRSMSLLLLSVVTGAAAFYGLSGDWDSLLPVWRSASDPTLDRLAVDAFMDHPWIGVGAGAFPLAAKLLATPADWPALGAVPDFGGSALRTFVVERGMIGSALLLISAGALGYSWFRRARLRGRAFFNAAAPLLPIAILAIAVLSVFGDSVLRADALVAFAALAALSVNGGK